MKNRGEYPIKFYFYMVAQESVDVNKKIIFFHLQIVQELEPIVYGYFFALSYNEGREL